MNFTFWKMREQRLVKYLTKSYEELKLFFRYNLYSVKQFTKLN